MYFDDDKKVFFLISTSFNNFFQKTQVHREAWRQIFFVHLKRFMPCSLCEMTISSRKICFNLKSVFFFFDFWANIFCSKVLILHVIYFFFFLWADIKSLSHHAEQLHTYITSPTSPSTWNKLSSTYVYDICLLKNTNKNANVIYIYIYNFNEKLKSWRSYWKCRLPWRFMTQFLQNTDKCFKRKIYFLSNSENYDNCDSGAS